MVDEIPLGPAVTDTGLVLALTERLDHEADSNGQPSPFGAPLPSAAQLIAQAIAGPAPTILQRRFQQEVGEALSALAISAGAAAAACAALSPLNAFSALHRVGAASSHPSFTRALALDGAKPGVVALIVERLAVVPENAGQLIRRDASPSVYILNGTKTVAPSNRIVLQGGRVQIELLAVAPGVTQTITIGPDREALRDAIQRFVDAVTGMAGAANSHRGRLAPDFVARFAETVQACASPLRQASITVDEDGTMCFDGAAFDAALAEDPRLAEPAITALDGPAQCIGQLAAEVLSTPISHFGAQELIPVLPIVNSHPSPPAILASHSLSALLYAQVFAQGLFINTLF